MTIAEIKQKIETNTLSDEPLIFAVQEKDSPIVYQYIEQIARNKNLQIHSIENLQSFLSGQGNALFAPIGNERLNIYTTEEKNLEIDPVQFNSAKNLIIVVPSIKTDPWLEQSAINIPKLETWMLLDYAQSVLDSNIKSDIIKSLVDLWDSPYRVFSEIDKLRIFDKSEQSQMLNRMLDDDAFSDLSDYDILKLTKAVIDRQVQEFASILSQIDKLNIEPMAFYLMLLKQFRNVFVVQLQKTITAEKVGLTDKQLWAIRKYSCGHYTNEQLLKIYKFLLSIDLDIMTGKLDTKCLIQYIACYVFNA